MNDRTEMLPAPLQEDSFDVVMRGYSRGQVDDFVKRTKRQVEELEIRLARAEREAEDARRDRDRASSEATAANRKLESHEPSYEELGERLTQILRLAQEEADQKRSAAAAEADEIRSEAEAAAERIHQELEERRSGAEAEADQIRAQARDEADRVRSEAGESAEQVRAAAEEKADRLVTETEERARRTEESARQRVEQLEEQHTQLLGQLSSVRDSLQTLLPGQVVASDQLDEAGEASTYTEAPGHGADKNADKDAAGDADEDGGDDVAAAQAETATVEAVSGNEPGPDGTVVDMAGGNETEGTATQPADRHR